MSRVYECSECRNWFKNSSALSELEVVTISKARERAGVLELSEFKYVCDQCKTERIYDSESDSNRPHDARTF